jgi:hypothetical protein
MITYPILRMTLEDATATRETRVVMFVMRYKRHLLSSTPNYFTFQERSLQMGRRSDDGVGVIVGYAAAVTHGICTVSASAERRCNANTPRATLNLKR